MLLVLSDALAVSATDVTPSHAFCVCVRVRVRVRVRVPQTEEALTEFFNKKLSEAQ